MRRGSRYDPYKDRFCPDGVFANGWRAVRKGGYVKALGQWWQAPELSTLTGELVHVQIFDYWASKVIISRGAIGCMGFYCYALPVDR